MDVDDKRDLLMNGVTEIESGAQNLQCDLYRNVAKLTLRLTNDANSNVIIRSVQLRNVPSRLFYVDQLYNGAAAPSPTIRESGFFDMQAEACELAAGDEVRELVYYLPRNRRGTAGTDRVQDKNRHAPEYATFVEIMAEDATAHTPLRYRFYLGANMTDDFNIVPNYHYTLPITINSKGDPTEDSRVEDMGNVKLESANSYIINPMSSEAQPLYSVPIGRINQFWEQEGSTDTPIKSTSEWVAEVIWQDQPTRLIDFSDATGAVVSDTYEGRSTTPFYFKPVQNAQGNVLIGVRLKGAGQSEYLWSWHLWITDYNPTYSGPWEDGKYAYQTRDGHIVHRYEGSVWTNNYVNKYIMDRNLGALNNEPLQTASYGLYYQFGRKDPFPGYNAASQSVLYDINGQEKRTFGPDAVLSDECIVRTPGPTSLVTSVRRPYAFYYVPSGDWMENNPYNSTVIRWNNPTWYSAPGGSGKSFFDPCPPGWRLPLTGTWIVFSRDNAVDVDGSGTVNSTDFTAAGGWYFYMKSNGVAGDEAAYYPASGYRTVGSGAMGNVGGHGYYWSASPLTASSGYNLYSFSGSVYPQYSSNRGNGFPVRCVQE